MPNNTTRHEAIKILKKYQSWRLGTEQYQFQDQKVITEALDFAIKELEEIEQSDQLGLNRKINKMKEGKIYISGAITGASNAFELFEEAENELKENYLEVVNPMKLPHNHDKTWASYMREDIKALCDCDTIYMLENWTVSKGAIIEYHLASDLGLKIIFQRSE